MSRKRVALKLLTFFRFSLLFSENLIYSLEYFGLSGYRYSLNSLKEIPGRLRYWSAFDYDPLSCHTLRFLDQTTLMSDETGNREHQYCWETCSNFCATPGFFHASLNIIRHEKQKVFKIQAIFIKYRSRLFNNSISIT